MMVPPLVLIVQSRFNFPDKQRLENSQLQASSWGRSENLYVSLTSLLAKARHEIFPHWLVVSSSSCIPRIECKDDDGFGRHSTIDIVDMSSDISLDSWFLEIQTCQNKPTINVKVWKIIEQKYRAYTFKRNLINK